MVQTDDSWNYSCRHQINLIIMSCTVPFIVWVIKAGWMSVCIQRPLMFLFTRKLLYYLDSARLVGNCRITEAKLHLVILFPLQQIHFIKDIFTCIYWSLRCLQSTSNSAERLKLRSQQPCPNQKVEKKKETDGFAKNSVGLVKWGEGMLANSPAHGQRWHRRSWSIFPPLTRGFNLAAREP